MRLEVVVASLGSVAHGDYLVRLKEKGAVVEDIALECAARAEAVLPPLAAALAEAGMALDGMGMRRPLHTEVGGGRRRAQLAWACARASPSRCTDLGPLAAPWPQPTRSPLPSPSPRSCCLSWKWG